jgi:hypothetical protein
VDLREGETEREGEGTGSFWRGRLHGGLQWDGFAPLISETNGQKKIGNVDGLAARQQVPNCSMEKGEKVVSSLTETTAYVMELASIKTNNFSYL